MSDRSMIEDIKASAKETATKTRENLNKDKLRSQLALVNRRALTKMSDIEIASWQSEFPESSPQAILANFEWQRRLPVMQIQSAQFSACLGLSGVIVVAELAFLFSYFQTK